MVYITAQEDLTDLASGVHWIFSMTLNFVFLWSWEFELGLVLWYFHCDRIYALWALSIDTDEYTAVVIFIYIWMNGVIFITLIWNFSNLSIIYTRDTRGDNWSFWLIYHWAVI